jgi:Flp pilus assembly pilin Flp
MKGLFMKTLFRKFLKLFFRNENGASALETVILLAIAATVVAVFLIWGQGLVTWGKGKVEKISNSPGIENTGSGGGDESGGDGGEDY